jgi:hypothetical protein
MVLLLSMLKRLSRVLPDVGSFHADLTARLLIAFCMMNACGCLKIVLHLHCEREFMIFLYLKKKLKAFRGVKDGMNEGRINNQSKVHH